MFRLYRYFYFIIDTILIIKKKTVLNIIFNKPLIYNVQKTRILWLALTILYLLNR